MNRLCAHILILCVTFPLTALADINQALRSAVKNGDVATAAKALEKGADLASVNKKGNTPLHQAASRASYRMVDFLIKKGAPLEAKNNSGKTPLMLAARKDQFHNVQILVAAGADLEAKDNHGNTAYANAAAKDNYQLAKYLKLQMKSRVSVAIFATLEGRELSEEKFQKIAEYAFTRKEWVVESKEGNVVTALLEKTDRLYRARMVLTPTSIMIRYEDGMGVMKVNYLNNILYEALQQLGL